MTQPGEDYRQRIYARYASCFKDAGPRFDEIGAARWGRTYRHYLRHWLPAAADAKIADLACGNGWLLHLLRSQAYVNLTGVDISPEQVRLSRQTGVAVSEEHVMPFLARHEGIFDLITAIDLVEHLTKAEVLQFLDACCGALRPGGRLILQTPNAESPWIGQMRYGDFTHEVAFTPNSLGRLLRLCGFDDVQTRETGPVPHGVPSALRWLAWRGIRLAYKAWNLAETGYPGTGIFTRVFLASALRAGPAR